MEAVKVGEGCEAGGSGEGRGVGREEKRFCVEERPVIDPGDDVTREREWNSEGV
jgi:hypothetical protein